MHLLILTKKKTYFEGKAKSLTVPGTAGYIQILQNHAPIIASLKTGKLRLVSEHDEENFLAISGGIFEFLHNKGVLLADTLESRDEIDIERAKDALKKALHKLEFDSQKINVHRTMEAIFRAQTRIEVYNSGQN